MRLATAVLACTQVTSIQELFKSHGQEFHIQPVSVRGKGVVWVEIYTSAGLIAINRVGTGWDPVSSHAFGYDQFFDVCKAELAKLTKGLN